MDAIWGQWGEPVLGLIEIGLLFTAVYLTIAQFRRSRASSYIERFNSQEMLESRVAIDRWLDAHSTPADRLAALSEDPHLSVQVRQFANLFQELGAAYQIRVAHRKTVRRLFDALTVMYWKKLRFWIEEYRARTDPTLYARFEYLYEELRTERQEDRDLDLYLFSYGSLMDPVSAAAALGRRVDGAELIPAQLLGYARSWSIADDVVVGDAAGPQAAVFLDLDPSPDARTWGALLPVRRRDLDNLKRREKNYRLEEVTSGLRLAGDATLRRSAQAWTFLGEPEHRTTPEDAVLLAGYRDKVLAAGRALGADVAEEIERLTDQAGFSLVDGEYRFVDAGQARRV